MFKKIFFYLIMFLFLSSMVGCAASGPLIIKTYGKDVDESDRNKIAILRNEQRRLCITGCDNIAVPRSARYILLQPGRHEVWFFLSTSSFLENYDITNKKYIDVVGGRTYILKSKGGGLLVLGDKWFPELFDVTDDINLHVPNIPQEIAKND